MAKAARKSAGRQAVTFSKLVCPSHEERVFYRFAKLMLTHERDFKLRVYPALGFSIVIPFIFIMTGLDGFSRESFASIRDGSSYLTIYFSLAMIPTVIITLKHSVNYKGAWIYKAAPLAEALACFQRHDEGVYGESIFSGLSSH